MKYISTPPPVSWELARTQKTMQKRSDIIIGVLALQGDFLEHIQTLTRIGIQTKEVRLPEDLSAIDAIILPGGESTTMAHLIDVFHLRQPLKNEIDNGMPVWGTCAGMILLAKKLIQNKPKTLEVMDITVNRNAFGRQIASFEADLKINILGGGPLHTTFIRAPLITAIAANSETIASLSDGTIVAAKQNNMIATSFHPELTSDTRFHEYFVPYRH